MNVNKYVFFKFLFVVYEYVMVVVQNLGCGKVCNSCFIFYNDRYLGFYVIILDLFLNF